MLVTFWMKKPFPSGINKGNLSLILTPSIMLKPEEYEAPV